MVVKRRRLLKLEKMQQGKENTASLKSNPDRPRILTLTLIPRAGGPPASSLMWVGHVGWKKMSGCG